MNTCYEMIDRHIDEGFGDNTGLIYDSPLIDAKTKYSYKELQTEVFFLLLKIPVNWMGNSHFRTESVKEIGLNSFARLSV